MGSRKGSCEGSCSCKASEGLTADDRSPAFPLKRRTIPSFPYSLGSLLAGSWHLVSKVISTFIGVLIKQNYSYLIYSPTY